MESFFEALMRQVRDPEWHRASLPHCGYLKRRRNISATLFILSKFTSIYILQIINLVIVCSLSMNSFLSFFYLYLQKANPLV